MTMSIPLLQKAAARAANITRSFLPAVQHQQQPLLSSLPILSHNRPFSSSPSANMAHDSATFKEVVQHRRTVYQLTKKSPISNDRIKEILTLAVKDVPSAFNSQSTRIVALFGKDHDRLWDVIESKLKPIVEDQGGDWSKTASRIKMFRDAYATILFYEDSEVIEGLRKQMPPYADKFPQWSEHTSAMHQYMLWTAFDAEGLGCNLQHYNPLPNKDIQEIWKVPANWDLKAQLVIGQPADGAREGLSEKSRKPIEDRLFIHGA